MMGEGRHLRNPSGLLPLGEVTLEDALAVERTQSRQLPQDAQKLSRSTRNKIGRIQRILHNDRS